MKVYALMSLTLLAYLPALKGGFISDDVTFFANDNLIHSGDGLYRIWFSHEAADFWPVTYSLFWICWRIFGNSPVAFHLLNVFVHGANALLIWRIAGSLTQTARPFAFAAALFFALHPVNAEAVAWIFQLKTTIAAFFALASLCAWIRFARHENRKKAWRSYMAALGLFALAIFSKTSVALWPLTLLLFLHFEEGRLSRRALLATAPFFFLALTGTWLAAAWYHYDAFSPSQFVRTDGPLGRIALAGWNFWFYLYKALLPTHLSFIYPRWQADTGNPLVYIPSFMAATATAWSLRETWRRPKSPLPYLTLYFLMHLVPVLGFVDIYYMRYSFVADHWQYTSLIGVCVLAAAVLARSVQRLKVAGSQFVYVAYVPAVMLLPLTFQRASLFVDEPTLWRATLRENPKAWLAEENLGNIMMGEGKYAEALAHFQRAYDENPRQIELVNNIGTLFHLMGDYKTAEIWYEKALSLGPPFFAKALGNLAALRVLKRDFSGAEVFLKEAVRQDPFFYKGFNDLGLVYLWQGRTLEAEANFRQALRIRPDDPEASDHLAKCREAKNRRPAEERQSSSPASGGGEP